MQTTVRAEPAGQSLGLVGPAGTPDHGAIAVQRQGCQGRVRAFRETEDTAGHLVIVANDRYVMEAGCVTRPESGARDRRMRTFRGATRQHQRNILTIRSRVRYEKYLASRGQ